MWKQVLLIWALITGMALLTGFLADARAEPYIQGWAGPSFWRDCSNTDEIEASCDAEPAGGISAGYQWYYLALEGEISARSATTHNVTPHGRGSGLGDQNGYVMAGLINVWPGFVVEMWRFYGGGGGGFARARLAGESDQALAWQVGAGFQYRFHGPWSADLGYRYLALGDTEHNGLTAEYDSHTILFGLRYSFGGE